MGDLGPGCAFMRFPAYRPAAGYRASRWRHRPARRLAAAHGRARAAQHVIDEVGRHRHLPAALLLAGKAPLDQARDDGAVAEGALHQAIRPATLRDRRRACPASNSSASESGRARSSRPCRRAPGGRAVIGGDEAERPRPPAPAAASAACRASGGRAGPRRDRRPCRSARRAERSRPAVRRASAARFQLLRAASRAPVGQRASIRSGSASIARTWVGQIGRERKLAAGIGGHLRVGAVAAREQTASFSRDALEAQHLAGEDEGVAGVSVSTKYSSISPSTRPPRASLRAGRACRARPSRTLSMVDSTMVPTFMRYCWARGHWDAPARPCPAGAWRSAHSCAAHSRRSRRNRRRVEIGARQPGIGRGGATSS
jgi:hypothetical protein